MFRSTWLIRTLPATSETIGRQANSNTNRIRIDTVIPELDLVSLASNNPDNSTAMAGDNVTLTVQSREALQTLELVHEDDTLESLTPIGGDGKQWVYSRNSAW